MVNIIVKHKEEIKALDKTSAFILALFIKNSPYFHVLSKIKKRLLDALIV